MTNLSWNKSLETFPTISMSCAAFCFVLFFEFFVFSFLFSSGV